MTKRMSYGTITCSKRYLSGEKAQECVCVIGSSGDVTETGDAIPIGYWTGESFPPTHMPKVHKTKRKTYILPRRTCSYAHILACAFHRVYPQKKTNCFLYMFPPATNHDFDDVFQRYHRVRQGCRGGDSPFIADKNFATAGPFTLQLFAGDGYKCFVKGHVARDIRVV